MKRTDVHEMDTTPMDQDVSFQYILSLPLYSHQRPYYIFDDVPEGTPYGNLEIVDGPEQHVEDVRGSTEEFNLDLQGFVFKTQPPPPNIDWTVQHDIENVYIPSIKDVIREALGGNVRICESFDWRIRHTAATKVLTEPDSRVDPNARMARISPAFQVHVDQTPLGVLDRMRQLFGKEADDLAAKHRVRLINVWRPLVDEVQDMPLAVCDARTASLADLIEVSFVDKGFIRHNFMAKHSDNFRFCYLSRMGRDEICIFKVFDSTESVAQRVLHSAFKSKFGGKPRESIEVRLLVLSELD